LDSLGPRDLRAAAAGLRARGSTKNHGSFQEICVEENSFM
jgi:hypothetical protein